MIKSRIPYHVNLLQLLILAEFIILTFTLTIWRHEDSETSVHTLFLTCLYVYYWKDMLLLLFAQFTNQTFFDVLVEGCERKFIYSN